MVEGEKRLNSLLRICTEGPECENFDATKAMNMWANNVIRRPNQNVRETYTPRPVKEKFITLVDLPESSDDDV